MPTPCTNCLRFHYGLCKEAPKQCYECGGINHIERYCPNRKNTIRAVPGEPLAGTRDWCEWHGLNDDPDLKKRILNSLKTTPGSAIFVNGICIYRGKDRHFSSDAPPRGRTLEERITRRDQRSLSPDHRHQQSRARSRERRPRTPSPRRRPPGYQHSPVQQSRYRSRSPLRQRPRTPSPYREPQYRARSPRYRTESNAVVFEARDRQPEIAHQQRRQNGRLTPVKFNLPPKQPAPRGPPSAFNAPPARAPLGQVSHNVPRSNQPAFNTPKQSHNLSTPKSGSMIFEVEDPHFVLNLEPGVSEAEIIEAYQHQIYVIETERVTESGDASDPNNVWNESIKYLKAAKRQLLGY